MAKYSRHSITISAVLFLEIFSIPSWPELAQRQPNPLSQTVARGEELLVARITYKDPDTGPPPGNRESSGTRGKACLTGTTPVTALVPDRRDKTGGLTVSGYPTFFFYVPATVAAQAELTLKDEAENKVYETAFTIDGSRPGIVSIGMPAGSASKPLEIGKKYQWGFTLICDSNDNSGNPFVKGWIQRVELSADLKANLDKAQGRDKAELYAESGWWYDALTALAGLRVENPTDPALATDWKDLLNQVELRQEISETPLVK